MRRFLASVFLALALPCAAGDLEDALAGIVRRLDADEPAVRDAAQTELETWCEAAGARAEGMVRAAQADASPEAGARLREMLDLLGELAGARERVEPLKLLGLPAVKGRPWVTLVVDGVASDNPDEAGWLIDETRDNSRVLTEWGEVVEFPRAGPDGAMQTTAPGDPGARRRALLEGEPSLLRRPQAAAFLLAMHARWALERSEGRLALSFLARFDEVRDFWEMPGEPAPEERECLERFVAGMLRIRAIEGAGRGMRFSELAALWRSVGALKLAPWVKEAARMAAAYDSYGAEEDARPEMTPGLSKKEQARVWVWGLRDVRGEGDIDGSAQPAFRVFAEEGGEPWPPKELLNLGDDAIPALIEAIGDVRPTRAVTTGRPQNAHDWSIVLVGEAAQDILRAMTGLALENYGDFHGLSDDAGPEEIFPLLRAAAEKWWAVAQTRTPAERAWDALPVLCNEMTDRLVEMNAEEWIPKLLRRAKDEPGMRLAILKALSGRLRPQDRDEIRGFLSPDERAVFLVAAEILWEKCGDDSGVRDAAGLVKPPFPANLEETLRVALLAPTDEGVAALRTLCADQDPVIRRKGVLAAERMPRADVAAMLAGMIDDKAPAGFSVKSPTRAVIELTVGDIAAFSLGTAAGFPETLTIRSFGARDELVPRIRKWWEAEKDRIDWEALQKKAREAK